VLAGDPKFVGSQTLPEFPYARYAEMLGLKGIRLDNPDHVAMAWEEAFDADCPIVIDARVDPEVPPLPPHITVKQARNLMSALLHRDEHAGRIIRQSYRDIVENYLPHKS
jgi:pyruvate dehydrogenase (quinone)